MGDIESKLESLVSMFDWEMLIASSLRIVFIFCMAFFIMAVVRRFLTRLEKRLISKGQAEGEPPSESQKRIETIIRLIKHGVFISLWVTVILIVLKEIGMEIGPVIASAGVVGLAVGFGAQNLVRDTISGFFMILENQIRVGDVAILNGTGGLVEKINFRTTVLRDLSGIVHVFPNGTITTISNLTNEWSAYVFDIGVAYKENTDKVVEILHQVGDSMVNDDKFGVLMLDKPEVFGVDKFADSAVIIKGRIRTRPIRQWDVGREFLRRVKMAFDEHGIEIPFPHRSIYFGDTKDDKVLQALAGLSSKNERPLAHEAESTPRESTSTSNVSND